MMEFKLFWLISKLYILLWQNFFALRFIQLCYAEALKSASSAPLQERIYARLQQGEWRTCSLWKSKNATKRVSIALFFTLMMLTLSLPVDAQSRVLAMIIYVTVVDAAKT